jgi:hypothetical protein
VKEQRLWFAGAVEALRDCPVRTTDDVVVREPATGRGLSRHAAIARNTAAARTVEFSCTEDVGDDRSSLAPQTERKNKAGNGLQLTPAETSSCWTRRIARFER